MCLYVCFFLIRGDSALIRGSLVVSRWRASGLPHHQRHAGTQHGSSPVHRQRLPPGPAVPVSDGEAVVFCDAESGSKNKFSALSLTEISSDSLNRLMTL